MKIDSTPFLAASTGRSTRSRYYDRRMAQIAEENQRAATPARPAGRPVSAGSERAPARATTAVPKTSHAAPGTVPAKPIDALTALKRLQHGAISRPSGAPQPSSSSAPRVQPSYALKPAEAPLKPIDPLTVLLGGRTARPVRLAWGASIKTPAASAWCDRVQSFVNYSARHSSGISYLRNGAILDLVITAGAVTAIVSGETLYEVQVLHPQISPDAWRTLGTDYLRQPLSALALLKGQLTPALLEPLWRATSPLLPRFTAANCRCTCPDPESVCKHVIAVLYGAAVVLDTDPELLFTFRGVSGQDLLDLPRKALEAQPLTPSGASRRLPAAKVLELISQEAVGQAPAVPP